MPSKFSSTKFSSKGLPARLAPFFLFMLAALTVRPGPPRIIKPKDGPAFRDDRILIIPKAGHAAALNLLHLKTGAKILKAFPATANIQVLEVPAATTAHEFVARYRQSGHVQAAELDHWIELSAVPNDPGFTTGDQWYLNNTGQNNGIADADIDAPEAWDSLNSASNIVVAVIDSGIRQTHEDLAANLWVNPKEIPNNGLDDDGNGIVDDVHGINAVANTGDPTDDYGHGSHVSGILGAVGNNGVGIAGVAWRVQIMACKFSTGTGGGSESDLIQCLDYARGNGASVLNCSFVAPGFDAVLSNAFWAVRNAGIVVVAAAGNSGTDNDVAPNYPASFAMDNVISVTATGRSDDFAYYNYGARSVHLGAPGVDILSTFNRSDTDYLFQSGTSMSTPCVAGAVALLRARFPSLDYRKIITRLLATTDPLTSLAGRCVTGGRLNLARALGTGDFDYQPVRYAWVPTNGLTSIALADDGVSEARPLPFTFVFYGETYSQVYVGANGLLGFINSGLSSSVNVDLPGVAAPNAILCPYWDDLNPALGGSVWFGGFGAPPNRKAVVSWVDVPHKDTSGGQTRFTFQAILHESGHVAFQYLQVASGKNTLVSGKSATIGVEDPTGLLGTKYSYNPATGSVTNQQAILFAPRGRDLLPPSVTATPGPLSGQVRLNVFGTPRQACVLSASQDLSAWTPLTTNVLAANGTFTWTNSNIGPAPRRFYRAVLGE